MEAINTKLDDRLITQSDSSFNTTKDIEPSVILRNSQEGNETSELFTDIETLQENLAHAESQTQIAVRHLEAIQEQLTKANEEKDLWYDQLLRQRAEFENFRKRVDREKQEIRIRTTIEIVNPMLEVLDNLDRAIQVSQSDISNTEALLSGIELIQKQLNNTLTNIGIKPVEAIGKQFDPELHEAVGSERSAEHEDNTVIEELKRGYLLDNRLVRPSIVKVVKN